MAVVGLSALARVLQVPYPIVLVLGGARRRSTPGSTRPPTELSRQALVKRFNGRRGWCNGAGVAGTRLHGDEPRSSPKNPSAAWPPEEIAAAVLWLCSGEAATVGHAVVVDGGQTA